MIAHNVGFQQKAVGDGKDRVGEMDGDEGAILPAEIPVAHGRSAAGSCASFGDGQTGNTLIRTGQGASGQCEGRVRERDR